MVEMIKEGYILPFQDRLQKPPLVRTPSIVSSYKNTVKNSALSSCVQDLLAKGAVEEVEKGDSPGFYSRLFLVPKKDSWRPVIDLSHLNSFLKIPKFKMETPESVRSAIQKGEWVTSIDLTDAYLHVPIHQNSRKFL